jgi:hypothetical protein
MRPGTGLAVAGDFAPEALRDEVVDNVHAESHAVLQVGSEEWVEYPLPRIRRHAHAIIGMVDRQPSLRDPGDVDINAAMVAAAESRAAANW